MRVIISSARRNYGGDIAAISVLLNLVEKNTSNPELSERDCAILHLWTEYLTGIANNSIGANLGTQDPKYSFTFPFEKDFKETIMPALENK